MDISLEGVEVILSVLLVLGSILGSWVATQKQIASVSAKIEGHITESDLVRKEIVSIKNKLEGNVLEVEFLKGVNSRLTEDSSENKMILKALTGTLSELNVVLGRFDERMKNVEVAVLKRDA